MSKLANAAHLGARYDQSTYSRIRVTIPARLIKPEDNRRIHNVRYFNRSSFSVCSAEVLKALLLCSTACSKAMLRFSRSVAHCAEPMNFNPRVPWGTRPLAAISSSVMLPFQSTRPVGDATPVDGLGRIVIPFQSTRPVGDATVVLRQPLAAGTDFNPRVPWGTRPQSESDLRYMFQFQSTRPVGDATLTANYGWRDRKISIHASRGGRDHNGVPLPVVERISIHASRGGRDRRGRVPGGHAARFQSTRPVGDATSWRPGR